MYRLTKWGNSVGLRLPAHVLGAAGLKAGDFCHIRLLDNGDIRLRPASVSVISVDFTSASEGEMFSGAANVDVSKW